MRKYRDFILDYLHLPVLERLKQVGMNHVCEYTYALLMKEFELLILDSNHLLIVC